MFATILHHLIILPLVPRLSTLAQCALPGTAMAPRLGRQLALATSGPVAAASGATWPPHLRGMMCPRTQLLCIRSMTIGRLLIACGKHCHAMLQFHMPPSIEKHSPSIVYWANGRDCLGQHDGTGPVAGGRRNWGRCHPCPAQPPELPTGSLSCGPQRPVHDGKLWIAKLFECC